ncbi:glycosyltransferase family 25 protein [Brucella gallinifaecis]|uniref:Glycosyltransferase family 25 protein n=1 Tax=Brucella gallinifaecis TaxID=215590 RepID=A0A502BND7_9HYPH|nr:glycosyltransferase family 25 protein [Brucella gallinifaecis]TPF76032.1 glycosyltransferase family 25 protein [Brucella gallinifaecis]
MKCYIINLDRAPERMKRMSDLLRSHSTDFIRCAAINGEHFTESEMLLYRSRQNQSKPLTAGEIACSESHLSAYRQIIAGTDEYAVIMEDDLHLSNDVGNFLNSTDWIPEGAEIIKLETVDEPTLVSTDVINTKNNRKLCRLYYKHWGSGAYVISKSAAKTMLDKYCPGSIPIDDYLFDPSVTSFSLWQLQPAIAVQDVILMRNSGTDIGFLESEIELERKKQIRLKHSKISVPALIKRETMRLIRKNSKRIIFLWGIHISKKITRTKIPFRM